MCFGREKPAYYNGAPEMQYNARPSQGGYGANYGGGYGAPPQQVYYAGQSYDGQRKAQRKRRAKRVAAFSVL